jgi:hypothetical protein
VEHNHQPTIVRRRQRTLPCLGTAPCSLLARCAERFLLQHSQRFGPRVSFSRLRAASEAALLSDLPVDDLAVDDLARPANLARGAALTPPGRAALVLI